MQTIQELNADYSQRAVLETANIQWETSEANGVLRKRLERIDAKPEPVTTIVRYQENSAFPAHQHVKGEEIFVLEGTFSDNNGDYEAGSYLRNPAGTSHSPFSKQGCTIFVKLQQFQTSDTEQVNIQTKQQQWLPGLVPGLSVMPLHEHNHEHVALVKWEANTIFQPHRHIGGEEIFVLEGTFEDEFGRYPKGTWLRNPPDSFHTPFTKEGCVIYVKTGHLEEL
ncbi:MAG: cupin domain-containing protein [Gammaproteobacteria bacterium]|nr:cupin domain-containing protein [Gammaproteobacteria bacterium]